MRNCYTTHIFSHYRLKAEGKHIVIVFKTIYLLSEMHVLFIAYGIETSFSADDRGVSAHNPTTTESSDFLVRGSLPISLLLLTYSVSNYVRFQILTAASMKFRIVFWDVLPCKIIVDRRFRVTCCLHHQGSLIV
jgi:hypothetical protein